MDFFNSLSEVVKNNKNFNRWEQEQRDNEAQRKELYNRRNYTPEEIEAAKQLGERIIDVVDIMDNHSENVAENVETATGADCISGSNSGCTYSWNLLCQERIKKISRC